MTKTNFTPDTLLTGSTGFVGTSIADALGRTKAHTLAVTRSASRFLPDGVTPVRGDITDRARMQQLCSQADTIIHAASYIGPDVDRNRDVNIQGTQHLVDSVQATGKKRLIYISSVSVYGNGPHHRVEEHSGVRPQSETSRSRVKAERAVLDAGGIVIRPALIYGAGDRWVIPSIVALTNLCGGYIENGQARVSMISVKDLGRLVAALAKTPSERLHKQKVFHAAYPEPVTMRCLVKAIDHEIVPLPGETNCSFEEAVSRAAPFGFTRHQVSMIAQDNWYSATRLWQATQTLPPTRGPLLPPEDVAWYRNRTK
ncbi:NAD-dependent epimerase/dehydratase family protein [Arthrobacter castelli]|uniref:NAD-dependent epimerase/dehydratase family protein n=1 Tax=Arthrobacter castelli TaxID=271431 RepID=UPI000685A808|nr:NAD(P)-dependent oxidoreductase [Arthrobacter castelli]